jgi:hypothetical protein
VARAHSCRSVRRPSLRDIRKGGCGCDGAYAQPGRSRK